MIGKCREREKRKIVITFRSNPTHNRKFQKNSKKIQKIKKIPLCVVFKPKLVGQRREREKRKTVIPFCSVRTLRVIENSKKVAKKFKKLKNTTMALSHAKIGSKMPRKREYKNYRSGPVLPDA